MKIHTEHSQTRAQSYDQSTATDHWHARISNWLARNDDEFPKIERDEFASFLAAWNQLHASADAAQRQHLSEFARACVMDKAAAHLLDNGTRTEQLESIALLGRLEEYPAWRKIKKLADSIDADVATAASLALIRINTTKAAAYVVGQIARRADWSHEQALEILHTAGAEIISHHLGVAALYAPNEHAPRLLHLLHLINREAADEVARFVIEHNENQEVTAACLQTINRPSNSISVSFVAS